jgi:hypothetical protein
VHDRVSEPCLSLFGTDTSDHWSRYFDAACQQRSSHVCRIRHRVDTFHYDESRLAKSQWVSILIPPEHFFDDRPRTPSLGGCWLASCNEIYPEKLYAHKRRRPSASESCRDTIDNCPLLRNQGSWSHAPTPTPNLFFPHILPSTTLPFHSNPLTPPLKRIQKT